MDRIHVFVSKLQKGSSDFSLVLKLNGAACWSGKGFGGAEELTQTRASPKGMGLSGQTDIQRSSIPQS